MGELLEFKRKADIERQPSDFELACTEFMQAMAELARGLVVPSKEPEPDAQD